MTPQTLGLLAYLRFEGGTGVVWLEPEPRRKRIPPLSAGSFWCRLTQGTRVSHGQKSNVELQPRSEKAATFSTD